MGEGAVEAYVIIRLPATSFSHFLMNKSQMYSLQGSQHQASIL